jgi:FkbM family methyltransferase
VLLDIMGVLKSHLRALGRRLIAPSSTIGSVIDENLIMDVGMHVGKDTEFYLGKGFRVVAVEADPTLVCRARQTFAKPISQGELTIIEAAVAETTGTITFYANRYKDDWGSADPAFARRNELLGAPAIQIEVAATTFDQILTTYGMPYYLKVDIEGKDHLCLEALRHFEGRPHYISIEMNARSFNAAFSDFSALWELGYRRFKVVNQAFNHKVTCPWPAREGRYVPAQFDGASSGPFGEEAPGPWLSIWDALVTAKRIVDDQPVYATLAELERRHRTGDPVSWYDIHAAK